MRYGRLPDLIAAAIVLLASLPVLAGTPAPGADAALDAEIAAQMEAGGLAGIGAAILVDGKVAWSKGYGHADLAKGVPFTPRTVMNIGSISKTVTGVALMQAVEDGLLSLDADINDYLPFEVRNPHRPGMPITLRQLATHTSGITDRWAVYRDTYYYDGATPEPLDAFLAGYFTPNGKLYQPDNFLDVAPGTHREYSNIGAGLAGYIVERAVGEPLGAYAKRRIFEPLGMRDSGWSLADIDRARHAALYVSLHGLAVPIPLYEGTTYPDGGVRTSVADLSRLFAALLGEGAYEGVRILEASSAREMLRFHYTEADKPDNVSLQEKNSGIFWQTKFNTTRMGHGGTDPGIGTDMLSSVSRDVGVVLFTNTSTTGEEVMAYVRIFEALWKRAQAMQAGEGSLSAAAARN